MVYLYTLPGINFSYPDIRNILYSTYLKYNKIKCKVYDYTDCFLNNILVNDEFKKLGINIEKIKHDIKDRNEDLLKANKMFIKAINKYLSKFGINYHNNRGFNYDFPIKNMDDLVKTTDKIEKFIDLFPIDNYKDNDIIFMNVSYGFQIPMAIGIARKIRLFNKSVKIVWGGNYLTQINKNCLKLLKKLEIINAIIVFNHLKTFGDIIKYYSNESVRLCNVITTDKEYEIKKVINEKFDYYYLDYSDVDLSNYLARDKILPILLNYGCYYHKCKFCAHYYHYGSYMKMNVKKICEMVKKMYELKKFDSIVFVDECIPPEMVVEFAKYLIENNIKTKWMIETRVSEDYLVLERVRLLKNSGCSFISFGIESYNGKVLKRMDKGIDIRIIKRVLKNFYTNGIVVSATFMIGYLKESYLNILRTLSFINHFKYIDLFGLNVFVLTRNSLLCESLSHDCSDINLTYRFKGDRKEILEKLAKIFNNRKKLRKIDDVKSCLLSRSDYLYLNRREFSINYREV